MESVENMVNDDLEESIEKSKQNEKTMLRMGFRPRVDQKMISLNISLFQYIL